jgi:hypothetical protein
MSSLLEARSAAADIEQRTAVARKTGSAEAEAEVLRARYALGRRLLDGPRERGRPPLPSLDLADPFPQVAAAVPEIDAAALDADLLRGALLHHGCLVVRGFFADDDVRRLRHDIDVIAERFDRWMESSQQETTPSWFEPFDPPGAELPLSHRGWSGALGCYYAGDSPRSMLHLIDAFDAAGLPQLLADYLGEPALIALEKTALRRVPNSVPSAWHQDGMRFGVDTGLVNVWVALCECGTKAPTVGVIPRRAREILPLHEGSLVEWEIDPDALRDFTGDLPRVELEMQPGDAVIFDEMLVHGTVARLDMPDRRYGADAWFFSVSGFPEDFYRPFAYSVPEA